MYHREPHRRRYYIRRRAQLPQERTEHRARLDLATRTVLTLDARRSGLCRRVIHGQLDGSAAAIEGEDDHEDVAIIPYKTLNGAYPENRPVQQ